MHFQCFRIVLPKMTTATFPHYRIMTLNGSQQINQEHEHSFFMINSRREYMFARSTSDTFSTLWKAACVDKLEEIEGSPLACFFISSPFTLSRWRFQPVEGAHLHLSHPLPTCLLGLWRSPDHVLKLWTSLDHVLESCEQVLTMCWSGEEVLIMC